MIAKNIYNKMIQNVKDTGEVVTAFIPNSDQAKTILRGAGVGAISGSVAGAATGAILHTGTIAAGAIGGAVSGAAVGAAVGGFMVGAGFAKTEPGKFMIDKISGTTVIKELAKIDAQKNLRKVFGR